ncbi:Na(+)/H(+) antiporter subunit B [Desulfosporosinus shakirovi]|uniref:Na(+)/H(+) antiporter subunit B n=1 Tax=Desulfosporosinus shakirovi TaxID=2885154 RepID=UPI001E30ABB8|nr:Na(+)/H(+) antiporter subunit B [Desulfosporosinus sp. SRJS8]MCB8816004.1 Na(+)/H(+) antiporter subunit B [Desulfosporosinus sp. SRJS8]
MNKHTAGGVGINPTEKSPTVTDQDKDIIKKTVTKFLLPFIQLFGLYVIVHGELGPGGGFQGGVILGVSVIVYALVFGLKEAQQRMSVKTKDLLVSSGVLVYGGIGVIALLFGGNYLQYNVLLPDPKFASTIGIMGIEIGVGITVAAVMITLFYETVRVDDND